MLYKRRTGTPCDCGNDDISEMNDGKRLCSQCRAEEDMGVGGWCRAYAVREQAIEEGEQYAADELETDEWLDDFIPAQYSAETEPLRPPDTLWRGPSRRIKREGANDLS